MKIVGNTVGTTLPKPDWNQTEPEKGGFIKNKPSATDGATFTPSVDAEGNLSWTNNHDLPNPNPINIKGGTFTPSVDADGNLSWVNDKDLPNPDPVNIKGEDGDPGYTPVKGTDYYTEEDKEEMVGQVLDSIPKVTNVSTVKDVSTTTMTLTMNNGNTSTVVVNYGENGDPTKITVDGVEVTMEFIYNILYLYNKGDKCEAVHGGWVASTRKYATNAKKPTITWGENTMTAAITDTTLNFHSGCVETANGVDLTNFNKLTFVITGFTLSNSGGDASIQIGVTDDLVDDINFDRYERVNGKGTYELDISALSGLHDIVIYLKTDVGSGNTAKVVISEIKLE